MSGTPGVSIDLGLAFDPDLLVHIVSEIKTAFIANLNATDVQ